MGTAPHTAKQCSPLHGTWHGLPPMLIVAGGSEYLRDHALLPTTYKASTSPSTSPRTLAHVVPLMTGPIGVREGFEGLGHMAFFVHDHLLRPLPPTLVGCLAQLKASNG